MFNGITDPFEKLKKTVDVNNKQYSYFNLPEFGAEYGNKYIFIIKYNNYNNQNNFKHF